MAIAFVRVTIHTRAKGHSATAASSYRSGSRLVDARTGLTHDYSARHDVVFSTVLLPPGASLNFADREVLWNQAERVEKRRDAQLCKDVVLALPKELDLNLQIELVQRFAHTHFVDYGLPADIAIHDHGNGNPHAHILIATRRLEAHGFSKYKARDLNPAFAKGRVVEQDYWGERWREMQNDFFAEKQLDLSVDLNHILPERHAGRGRYLLAENQLIQYLRRELVITSPEQVIDYLSKKHSVHA